MVIRHAAALSLRRRILAVEEDPLLASHLQACGYRVTLRGEGLRLAERDDFDLLLMGAC